MQGPTEGSIRDPQTGGLMTVANAATDTRTAPVAPRAVALPPAVAGVLGVLALVAAVPAALVAAWPAAVMMPAWIGTAAAIGGALTPFFTGLAFWAQGGNPLDLVTRKPAAAPSPVRVGPPEP